MNRRIQQFLELEDLSPAKLSEILGIQRSGLSHILAGRNKPSFDFIERMLTKFPNLSAEWLITGKGKPYKDQPSFFSQNSNTSQIQVQEPEIKRVEPYSQASQPHEIGLFDFNLDNEQSSSSKSDVIEEQQSATIQSDKQGLSDTSIKVNQSPASHLQSQPSYKFQNQNRVITRITVFYSDGTFEER